MKNIDNLAFGDIAVADLPYTDGSKTKIRPVLILAKDRDDYLLLKITSILEKKESLDIAVSVDSDNNLEEESLIKIKKIGTYSKQILLQKIGTLSHKDCQLVKKNIKAFVDDL